MSKKFSLIILAVAFPMAAAALYILSFLLKVNIDDFNFLTKNLLIYAFINSFSIAFFTSLIVLVIGVTTAWFVSQFSFPGRGIFNILFLMPLAIPPYVLAIVHTDLFDYSGILQTMLRHIFNSNMEFFHGRAPWGLVMVLSISLYPYVYMLSKTGFNNQGNNLLHTAKSLGLNSWQAFFKLALPVAKPWWISGIVLVTMEVFSDFGSFSAFGVENLTTAIYQIWNGMYNLPAAMQVSCFLILIALLLNLFLNTPVNKKFTLTSTPITRVKLTGFKLFLVLSFSILLTLTCFFIPLARLIIWALGVKSYPFSFYFEPVYHSFVLGFLVALATILLGTLVSLIKSKQPNKINSMLTRTSTIGYAIPSIVLGIGFYILAIQINNLLIQLFNLSGLFIQGSLLVVVFILTYKFQAVGFNASNNAINNLRVEYGLIAKTFALSRLAIFFRIKLPLLKRGLFAGFILVFIDAIKELPITLIARPFGWNTLAIKIYEYTGTAMYEEAAIFGLIIIFCSFFVILILANAFDNKL